MGKTVFTIYGLAAAPKHRVLVAIPYNVNLSKNKQHGITRTGRMYTLPAHKKAREELAKVINDAVQSHRWEKKKYWLAIHVQKPSNRGDCANYLDAIADVAKKCIGVDDNYLEVEKITYEVQKDGKIFISIAQ